MGEKKDIVVGVRMDPATVDLLDRVRGQHSRGEFMRRCFADVIRRNRESDNPRSSV